MNVLDLLMEYLETTHKLMRIAYEDHSCFLVEVLEYEREGLVAQAAAALALEAREAVEE